MYKKNEISLKTNKYDILKKTKKKYIQLTLLFVIDALYLNYLLWYYKKYIILFIIAFSTFLLFTIIFTCLYRNLNKTLNSLEGEIFISKIYIDSKSLIGPFFIYVLIGPLYLIGIQLMYTKSSGIYTIIFIASAILFFWLTLKKLINENIFMGEECFASGKRLIPYENIGKSQTLKLNNGEYEFIFYEEKQLFRLRLTEEQKEFIEIHMKNNHIDFLYKN